MAEPIDTAFVEIVPDFRNFGPQVKDGVQRGLQGSPLAVAPDVDTRNIDRKMRGIRSSTSTAGQGFALLGSQASRATQIATFGVAGIGIAAGLAAKEVISAGIEFETAFAGVRKTVDASEDTLSRIRKEFIDLSTEIPVTTTELAAIGEAAGQLGIETSGITEFTETVAQLGVTTNLTSEQAADSLARLANITQLPQSQFDNLGATIVALGNRTASTEAEIVEFGLRISGAGTQIGLTQDQILSFGAALASVGLNAEAGGTAISTTFVKIASDVASGGGQLREFAKVAGQSSEEFAESFRTRPAQAVTDFIQGLGRVKAEGGNVFATLDRLGLGGIRVRDALLRSAAAGDLLTQALATGNQAWQENNALQREAAIRFDTTQSKITLAKNEFKALAIEIGGQEFAGRFAESLGEAAAAARGLVQDLKGIGGDEFDAVNADLTELLDGFAKLNEEREHADRVGLGEKLSEDAREIIARIDEIGQALNRTPGGVEKLTRIFGTAFPAIEKAMRDGIITPSEQAEIRVNEMGRAFLRALPPSAFQEIPVALRRSLEDTGAAAKSGAAAAMEELKFGIEEGTVGAEQAASAAGEKIGESLATAIARAAQQAVTKAGNVTGASDEAVDAAIAAGDEQAQIQALERKRDSLAAAIARVEEIKNPGKARVEQRRKLRRQLAQTTTQLESIEAGIIADQEAAKAEAEQKADKLRSDAQERDRDFLEGLEDRRATAERGISAAEATPGLRDDLRRNQAFKALIRNQIDLVKERVKDADIRNQALRTLRDALQAAKNEETQIKQDIEDATLEAKQTRVENTAEALGDITSIAAARGDRAGQERGLQAEIRFWRKVALGAKRGSAEQRKALLALEEKRAELRELLDKADSDSDAVGGTSLADLFAKQTAITRGAGFDVGPQISGNVTQPIENEVAARLEVQRGLDVRATVEDEPKRAADPQIDRLIAALERNTAATVGNSTSGGKGMQAAYATSPGSLHADRARFHQARQKARLMDDVATGGI